MKEMGSRIANWVPPLSKLETSSSTKRSLNSEDPHSRANGKKSCASPTVQLPLLSRSKPGAFGDDYGSLWGSRIRWFACFILVTLTGTIILGNLSFSGDWNFLSFRCSGTSPSRSSLDFMTLLSSEHDSQDGRVGKPLQRGNAHEEPRLWREPNAAVPVAEEDETCWSRTRQILYRRTDRQSPQSPLLGQALQKYATMHARCNAGRNWKNLKGIPLDDADSCKYLFYLEGTEGLGNRLLSLVSAFTYALATDRVLLLDDRKNLSGLLCEPFSDSSWILPLNFPYERIDAFPTLGSVGEGVGNEVAVKLNLRHEQSQQDQRFFCADFQDQLDKVQWVSWLSNQYYVTRLVMIPAFWEKLNPLFDDPSRVFTQLSRYLLLPKNAIWEKVQRVYLTYLATSTNLVGLQVRAPRSLTYSQRLQYRMMQCLFDDLILPKSSGPHEHRVHFDPTAGDTAIFVASLHRGYSEAWRKFYLEHGSEDGSLVSVHTVASDGVENESYDQSVKAFIDMWLLSFSDTLVTSGWSTFGYVAQGLGAVYPYIINTDMKQPLSCSVGQSVEPCTHYPFLSSCPTSKNLTMEQNEWMKKHLRDCQDQPDGLQLIP